MKWRNLIAGALLVLTTNVWAEDKLSAEINGTVEVDGITETGGLVGDKVPSFGRHNVSGKVNVVINHGDVHRVETYTYWDAQGGVRAQVWEKLYVSGGTYTGWSERLIQTPANITFSRNVIDGEIEQEIKPDGSGFIQWTVTGGDNEIESSDDDDSDSSAFDSSTDSGRDLPTVEILEEGEFDGVSARGIEIDPHGSDRATVKFHDRGYAKVTTTNIAGDDQILTINQRLTLEGDGKGSLAYDPDADDGDDSAATPSPTPLPAATPQPVNPLQTTQPTNTFDDGSGDDFF